MRLGRACGGGVRSGPATPSSAVPPWTGAASPCPCVPMAGRSGALSIHVTAPDAFLPEGVELSAGLADELA